MTKSFAKKLFNLRSYTPIPFLIVMLTFYKGNLNSWIIGLVIVLIGEFTRLWGVNYAGGITRTTTSVKAINLVTSGPFAYVRNPIYIGNVLTYLGIGFISMALFPYLQLAALIWFMIQYHLIIGIEEEFLESKFGQDYVVYKNKVPKFIPTFSPYRSNSNINKKPNIKNGLKSEVRTIQALVAVLLITYGIHSL